MYYGDDLVNEVREKNDIVDVISGYVKLKKQGSNYFGLCPFHNEKSPSFSVTPSKQMFYCFGCGKGGNVYTFIREYEGCSFQEAFETLAERAGVKVEKRELSEREKKEQSKKQRLMAINKRAATYYYACLRSPAGETGLRYLKSRGVDEETARSFGLGFAPPSGGLIACLKKEGYSDEEIRDSGLAVMNEKYGMSEKFWNRVIFPIMNISNKVVGFGGRVMGDGKPKYLNSPETAVFEKSRHLYGLNVARSARTDSLILCEGYMDVISMHQAGFKQAVASLGTAFTTSHASLLSRYAKSVLLLYDSDDAGVTAALRAIPICNEVGIVSRVVDLKPYKDPDEFIKNLGAEEFRKRLDNAVNSFYFELSVLEKRSNMSDPKGRSDFIHEAARRIAAIDDEIERDSYTKGVASRYMVEPRLLSSAVAKAAAASEGMIIRESLRDGRSANKPENEDGMQKAQRLLITAIADHPEIFSQVKAHIGPGDFLPGVIGKVAATLFEQLENDAYNPAAIIDMFDDEEEHSLVAKLFNSKYDGIEDVAGYERFVTDLVIKIKKNALESSIPPGGDEDPLESVRQSRRMSDALRNIHIKIGG